MYTNQIDFKEIIKNLENDELRKIVYVDFIDYQKEFVEFAKEELSGRYKENIYENENLTFGKLLEFVSFGEIEKRMLELHPDYESTIPEYKKVYEKLFCLQTEETKNSFIYIENPSLLNNPNKETNAVFGVDVNTGDIFEIKYCLWKDWLSFLIKKEQIQQIGIIDFVILCLREMTYVSFDEDEIQKVFDDIVTMSEEIESTKETYLPDKALTVSDFILEGIKGGQTYIKESIKECPQVRPWIRFFARTIDTLLFFSIAQNIWIYLDINSYKIVNLFAKGIPAEIFYYLIWIVIEAILISKYGFTLGKWLLNVKVRNKHNEKLSFDDAFKRTFEVLIFGEGLCIPFIAFIAKLISYDRLVKNGITKWDKDGGFVVAHSKIEKYKALIAIFILIVYPIFYVLFIRYLRWF